jgi:hypothetical protein
MVDLAHEEVLLFLALLAISNVSNSAHDGHGPPLVPVALEIRKPQSLHPADLAASALEPELGRRAIWIDGIEPRLERCQNSFDIVRMHQS